MKADHSRARLLAACAAVCVTAAAAAAALRHPSTAVPATLESAIEALRGGDAEGAARMLARLAAQSPRDARVWRALGRAELQRKHAREAIAAYRQALTLEPEAPQVFYALGAAYASLHERGQALEWLERAHDSRRFDMTELTADPNVAAYRADPEFAALLPREADFAQPFVEPVHVIHEWRGEAAGDQFGWIARNIGDVDGDGINDVVVSAPTHGPNEAHAGRIYVYSGRSGRLLWTADGAPGDELGTGVEAAGDTNADGIPDVVASGPSGKGIAHIYSGRDGRVLHTFHAPDPDEEFGRHSSGAGDVDGDGCADVIVGSPGRDGEQKSPGHAYVYSGRSGQLLLTLTGERPGDQFGSTVAGYQHGGAQLLVVGAARGGKGHHGRVYVYAGAEAALRFVVEADDTGNALGAMFVSVPGDLDGDGIADIYAADWTNNARGVSTGRIYVHSGRTGERLLTLTGESEGEGFGTSPAVAGDVDGDGRADLIVGAWQYGKAAVSGGRAYLYSGRTGRLLRTYTDRVPGDTLGFDAVGLGDAAGDGTVALLITAAWSAVHGHHSGRVFVIGSGVDPRAAVPQP
jgi:hypothetical protein